jgi:hypothetical protein
LLVDAPGGLGEEARRVVRGDPRQALRVGGLGVEGAPVDLRRRA